MIVPGGGGEQVILLVFKYGMLAVSLLHVLFSVVVALQVRLMTNTLRLGFELPVIILALLHLLLSVGVFITLVSLL